MFAVVFVRGVRSSLLGAHVVGLEDSVERITQEGGPRKRCGVSIIREPFMNRGLRTPARSAGWAPSFLWKPSQACDHQGCRIIRSISLLSRRCGTGQKRDSCRTRRTESGLECTVDFNDSCRVLVTRMGEVGTRLDVLPFT